MLKKLLMLLVCLSVCLGFTANAFSDVSVPVKADTTIAEDRQRLAELQAKLGRINGNLNGLEQEKAEINAENQTMLEEKKLLEQEITLINEQVDTISAIIAEYDTILEKTAAEKAEKETELDSQLDEFSVLLVELYKSGDDTKFEIFLQAKDYSSYVSYVEYMGHILKSSDTMINDINDTITAIEEREKEYEDASEKLKEKEKELEAAKKALEEKNKEIDEKLGENREWLELTEEEKAQMEKEEQDLLKEIGDLQQQINDKVAASYNGQFSWPFASNISYVITSRFGTRSNPFNGSVEHHNGLDIAGIPKGTAIRAVDAGIVTYAGYRGAFGNVVFIEHGGGLTTVYAHCDSLLVTAGTKVLKDQVIARVGNTGNVTGVHLHFAVSKNGSYVDPEKYLPTYFTKGA